PRRLCEPLDELAHAALADRFAIAVEKECVRHYFWSLLQPVPECQAGLLLQCDLAVFASFAIPHDQDASGKVNIRQGEATQFADPDPRLQKHLEDRKVARARTGKGEDAAVLVRPQARARTLLLPGRVNAGRWVLTDVLLVLEIGEECAK